MVLAGVGSVIKLSGCFRGSRQEGHGLAGRSYIKRMFSKYVSYATKGTDSGFVFVRIDSSQG
jgi:hypothetical protein